jgi:hypothetical protein
MTTDAQKNLKRLVQDHKIQAGIGLAVAMGVWHFKGRGGMRQPIYKTGEVIDVLKENERMLISDPDGILHIVKAEQVEGSLCWVSRVAYIGAVVILAANAIDIQRQIREPEPESKHDYYKDKAGYLDKALKKEKEKVDQLVSNYLSSSKKLSSIPW